MNTKTNHAPGEIGPWVVLSWLSIAFAAYWFLPWTALEYGITDFTWDEWLDALGWHYRKATLMLPGLLALMVPLAWIRFSKKGVGWVFTIGAGLAIATILLSFVATDTSMGLGTGVVMMCLAALFAIGISELGFQRGDTFIAGAVIFVVFMVGVFIFFPVWEIFRNVLFDKADAFVLTFAGGFEHVPQDVEMDRYQRKMKQAKRDIARIQTIIREMEVNSNPTSES